jgi:murein DD-endopeptidase MepM/ murein hydrolase activator NlpD
MNANISLIKPFVGDYPITQGFEVYSDDLIKAKELAPGTMHYGLDYGLPVGTPVLAACDGVISFVTTGVNEGEM